MSMNKKSVSLLVLSAIVASVVVSWTNANMFSFSWVNDKTEMNFEWMGFWNHFKKWVNGNMKWLTDEEKTALESMTDEEKTAFYETKRAERQAVMEANKIERELHEGVIDKLIDWVALTDEEKVILEEIKTKRAERKALRLERESQMAELKVIMDKKNNWETLTDEETAKLEELWKSYFWDRWGMKFRGWFMHR